MTKTILHKLLFLLIPSIFALISSKEVYACDNPPIAGTASISATVVCEGSGYTVNYEGGTGTATWQYWDGLAWVDDQPANSTVYYIALYPATIVNGIPGDRFRVKTTTGGDCISYSNEVAVGYISRPVAGTASISATDVCQGSIFTIKYDKGSLFVENGTNTWQYWEDASSDWIDFADASQNPLSIEATNPYTMVNGLPGNRYRVKVSNSICENFSNEIAVSFNQLPTAGTAIISATAACLGSLFSIEIVGASNINGLSYWEVYIEAKGKWINTFSERDKQFYLALNPGATVNGLPGDKLRVHHTNSCGEQFSNEVSIIYAPYPEVSITAVPENNTYTGNNPNTILLGYGPQKITLQSSVTGNIGNGFNYNWTGTGLSCTDCASPVFKPTAAGNYNFTLTASTLLSASAETGKNNALLLNGIDNYVEDNSVVIDPSLGFTVEGWINFNSLDALNGFAAKTLNNIPAPFDVYINTDGSVTFLAGDGNDFFYTSSSSLLAPGEWNHIACVYDPANSLIRIYVNGKIGGESVVDNNLIADNGTSFRIGSRSDDAYFTNGKEDEIRVWNVARNYLEINAGMNTTLPANSTGLIAYYKLDETSGTSVLESVSNTNRGILRGSSANWVVPTTAPVQPMGLCPTTKSITICVKDVRVPGKKTQVYMCHNSNKGSKTIILNPQDVPAHLAHGDALGQCGQGCGSPAAIALKSSGLSIDEAAAGMMVYPNPAKNSVTVSFNATKAEKYQLQVMDITGRAVLTRSDNAIPGNNKVQVNIGGIASGTYLIIVKKGDETLHSSVVKQ